MRFRVASVLLAGLLLGACRAPGTQATDAQVDPSHQPTASPTTSSTGVDSQPGRPYSADDLLAAMRDSRRPGGVPDELETAQIASTVADEIWTWDGTPWQTISIGAGCGLEHCSLEVAGAPIGSEGVDLYSFSVDRAAGEVALTASDLHGYPTDLEPRLDAVARSGVAAGVLAGMELLAASWLPPPDAGRYRLAYRSGGEEGSPGVDVLIELATGRVISVDEVG